MSIYEAPGRSGSVVSYDVRYDHWIGGEYVAPAEGRYFENVTPVTGQVFTEIARGTAEDVERALDATHGAAPAWGRTSTAERANVLWKIADRMEQNLELLAVAETWDNGKPVRETLAADIPLAIGHFRYFAGAIRAQEGGISEIDEDDEDAVAYHYHEPFGVVVQITRGTPPSSWRRGSSRRRSPPATRWCSNRPSRPATGSHERRQRVRRGGGQAARVEPAGGEAGVHR
jgi:aldehyde dehydrogenase